MKKFIDLHVHSTASDGSMSPGELVRYAVKKELAAIAITDHDTIDGIPEAIKEGKAVDVEVIPGLEISADYIVEMHILGYFFNGTYLNIRDVLKKLRENRDERNPKIIAKLNQMGFSITLSEVKAEAHGNVIGRPHIAKTLVKNKHVRCVEDAFDKYLSFGKPAYFKKEKLDPEQCIKEILQAGGIPVLAHPVILNMSFKQLDDLLFKLKAYGLMGIEAYYVDNTKVDTGNFLRLAIKHGLLATGGSDFHGSFKPDIDMGCGRGGLGIPYELLDKMKKWVFLET